MNWSHTINTWKMNDQQQHKRRASFYFFRNLRLFKSVGKNIDSLMLFLLISPFVFYIIGVANFNKPFLCGLCRLLVHLPVGWLWSFFLFFFMKNSWIYLFFVCFYIFYMYVYVLLPLFGKLFLFD